MATVLVHHGIKGQKWGVRRYQNEDGSLTAAGKKKYGTDDPTIINPSTVKKGLTTAQKVLIGVGAAAVVGGAAYGISRYVKDGRDTVLKSGRIIQRMQRTKYDPTKLHDMLYVSENKRDNKTYERLMPFQYKQRAVKKELEVTGDIKIASNKQARRVFDFMKQKGYTSEKTYDAFNRTLVYEKPESKRFFDLLKGLGYGGVQDRNDVVSGYKTKNPLILFGDSSKKLSITKNTIVEDTISGTVKEYIRSRIFKTPVFVGGATAVASSAYGAAWYKSFQQKQQPSTT